MREILFMSLILLGFVSCKDKGVVKSDSFSDELIGGVESCKYSTFEVVDDFGKIIKKEKVNLSYHYSSNYITNYNLDGFYDSKTCYRANGKLSKQIEYEYDSKGNLINVLEIEQDQRPGRHRESKSGTKYEYDSNNKKIKEMPFVYMKNDIYYQDVRSWKYNDSGDILEIIEFERNSEEVRSIKKNIYDTKGNRIRFEWLDGERAPWREAFDYIYDDNNNLIETITSRRDKSSANGWKLNGERTVYTYDGNNKTSSTKFGKDGKIKGKNEYVYNNEGVIVKSKLHDGYTSIPIEDSTWNDKGYIIKNVVPNYEGEGGIDGQTIYKWTYEYDANNNWVKRIEYIDGVASFMVEREITYLGGKKLEKELVVDEVYNRTESTAISNSINNKGIESAINFKDVSTNLLDASPKKIVRALGKADEVDFLKINGKFAMIYYDKVMDNNELKHLVLFIRKGDRNFAEDIKAVSDNQKAYFGIHYIKINNKKVTSNSTHWGL